MQVTRGDAEQAPTASVLTIGNFDGIHRGHQALLRLLTDKAHTLGLPAVVLTFEPHPREYFSPGKAPARLASLREKLLLLAAAGVDITRIIRFNARFAAVTAEHFIETVLVRNLKVRHLIIGDDFRFGAGRKGDFAMLQAAGERFGFVVEAMPTHACDTERVSSSAVRAALAEGNLDRAAMLLGRAYSIAGRVIHGDKIGRKLGYPTANIQLKGRHPPLSGVYAVAIEGLGDALRPAVASVGVRPTVNSAGRPTLEVHLFDFDQDCYGAHLRVHFLHKLRDEQKFDSFDALTAQIARDADAARAWLSHNSLDTSR
ncbi:bifunctional riboflavin kinase/FAD synthetase [Denitromonas iodatirespirans]|uniref:Riboflavin biosynthesis protein n=1 Tax=Denitromonas iodatirespirans TaxID=2795389 RepID=A0A944DBK6_DENI1|nr:bifunctional riboflavin kinase/FAD synthetase [Denitromonas iodatirespirans]MBT0959703.1 bifunctional riboflavin kinase/FAD synthetase [Denitromonas iodatirespirans]